MAAQQVTTSTVVTTFRRLQAEVPARQRLLLLAATAVTVAGSFLVDLPAVLVGRLVDQLAAGRTGSAFAGLALIAGALVLGALLRAGAHLLVHGVAPLIESSFRERTLGRALRSSANGQVSAAAENAAVGRGAEGAARMIRVAYADLVPTIATGGWALLLAFHQRAVVGFAMVLTVPVSMVIVRFQVRSQGSVRVRLERVKAWFEGIATEHLRGREVLRSLGAVPEGTDRLGRDAQQIASAERSHHLAMGRFDLVKSLNEAAFTVGISALGIVLVTQGSTSPGSVLTMFMLYGALCGPLRSLHRIVDDGFETAAQGALLLERLERPVDPAFDRASGWAPDPGAPAVDVQHATLRFEGREELALDDVSLRVAPGQMVGLVGATGSGKSTLGRCIAGLLPLDGGMVRLSGCGLASLNVDDVASVVAHVPQHTFLVSGSIRENLLFGLRREVTDVDIWAALRSARVDAVVAAVPGGLDGDLSEDGRGLSGGERQRLAIARALLRTPEVLILDEATSALDNEHEAQVMESIVSLGITVIAIAHRLETLRASDVIHVMDRGRIVESGSFEALLAEQGAFARLAGAHQAALAVADGVVVA